MIRSFSQDTLSGCDLCEDFLGVLPEKWIICIFNKLLQVDLLVQYTHKIFGGQPMKQV